MKMNKYYGMIKSWKELTEYEIMFRRMYVVILSVLVFTNVIEYVNNERGLISIYVVLILLGLIENKSVIEKAKKGSTVHYEEKS